MNIQSIQSLARHAVTYLAGIGGLLLSWHLIAPDQVDAVNKAGAELIAPLTIILGAVAACVARMALTWIFKLFGSGAGERSSNGIGLGLVWVGAAAGLICTALPSCSAEDRQVWRMIPIRSVFHTDYGSLGYSSKSGISIEVDQRSAK